MDFEGFMEIVRSRRSIRRYEDREVTERQVSQLLEAARWAPTGGNIQPWEFIIIREKKLRREIVDTTYVGNNPAGPRQEWLMQAPVFIVACVNPTDSNSSVRGRGRRRVF